MLRTVRTPGVRRTGALSAVLAAALIAGCSSDGRRSDRAATTSAPPSASVSAAPPAALAPVIPTNFPDPDVMVVGKTYYAFATEQPGGSNVQAMSSTDLETWKELPDAMPTLPEWAIEGRTWAPEVFQGSDDKYVLWFTARHAESDRQCIGVAVASKPAGPFKATADKPAICPVDQGGAIDAASYTEGGKRYLLWKNDGNCCGKETWLYVQPLNADGTRLVGKATRLIKQDKDFEGELVEAPTLWKQGGRYFLFYSANFYGDESYLASYATATKLTGPYKKADEPLMTTERFGEQVIGPGGQDVFPGPDGKPRIAFHGWDPARILRAMYVQPITFEGDQPVIEGLED